MELKIFRQLTRDLDDTIRPEFANNLRFFRVDISGHIFDHDYESPNDERDYGGTHSRLVVPGGLQETVYDYWICDGEVEVKVYLTFAMQDNETLFVNGVAQLFEGNSRSRDFKVEDRFNAVGVERGVDKQVANLRLDDDEGDWATVNITVKNHDD